VRRIRVLSRSIAATTLVCFLARAQTPNSPALKPPKTAASAEAASVLILVNAEIPPSPGTGRKGASEWVGEYYAAKRGIPAGNILHLNIPCPDGALHWNCWHLSWADFNTMIREPLLKALNARGASNPIRYIVPVWGVPSHVSINGEGWSVDSFLASVQSGNTSLGLRNPYHAGTEEAKAHFANWQNPAGWRMYLVTRLDGPTPQIATGLVDKAMRAETSLKANDGIAYFDFRHLACCDGYTPGDRSVENANRLSASHGFRSVFNDQGETKHMLQEAPNTLWAWGWYSGAVTNDVYQFVEGAVGAQLTSYTADGIRVPRPGAWVELWLRRGITATWGATTEPTVAGYALGDNFFAHFWTGYNFAESSYLASPALNHAMVFVGDPLYSPLIFRSPDH
jgi:uncharacterized protein (TIGR03790 family)